MKKKKLTLNKDFLDQESKRKSYDTEADYQRVDSDDALEAIYAVPNGPVIKSPEEIREHRHSIATTVPVKKQFTPKDMLNASNSRPKDALEEQLKANQALAQIHYDNSFSGKISSLISYVTGNKNISDDIKDRIEEVTEAISEAISTVINSNNQVQHSKANLDASAHPVFDLAYAKSENIIAGDNVDRKAMARAKAENVRVENEPKPQIPHNPSAAALRVAPALSRADIKNPLLRAQKTDPTSVATSFSRPPSPSEAAIQAGAMLLNSGAVRSDQQADAHEGRNSSSKKGKLMKS